MRKPLLLLLLPLLGAPALAAAQLDPEPVHPRFAVTAYTGARVSYNTGFVAVLDAEGAPLYSTTERRGGGALLGLDAEMRLVGPLSVLAGATYSPGGISSYYLGREPGFRDTADFRVRFTEETLFARAGLSMRLQAPPRVGETRPRPATDLFAAAGLMRQFESEHPAANFGFKGSYPVLTRGLEVVVGIEDYLVFWDEDAISPLLADVLRPSEDPVGIDLLYDTSNVVLVRAGLAFRF